MTTEVYTTADLLAILAAEQKACMSGQRLNLKATVSGVNPLIDQFLNPEGVQKFSAYQDFRAAVHHYQQEHQVSGILWKQVSHQAVTLTYPEVDEQLIALPSDLEILRRSIRSVYDFWHQSAQGMDLYQSIQRGRDYQKIQYSDVERLIPQMGWANIRISTYPVPIQSDQIESNRIDSTRKKSNLVQIVLQLGWGQPREAIYNGYPEAGSEFIYALAPGYAPIPCSN
jgi:hypothetical protein